MFENGKFWSAGPDHIMPIESYMSTSMNKPVKLRINDTTDRKIPPISIYSMFKSVVDARPDHPALVFQNSMDEPWETYSYMDYWILCHKAARSFIKLGVCVSECVAIVGFNAPPWFIAHLGTIIAGFPDYIKKGKKFLIFK